MKNSSDKGISSDGIRVSEESKVLAGDLDTENITRGSGWEAVQPGSLGMKDKQYGSKNRVEEMMSRGNGWGSWGVMNLVGRVLGGKFSMDEEMEDVKNSENGHEVNPVSDTTTWQGVIGESTCSSGVDVKGTEVDQDSDKLNSGLKGGGNGLNGNQDLVYNEMVPDGKLKTDGVNDARVEVLIPEGNLCFRVDGNSLNGNQDLVPNEMVPDGNLETERVNDDRADVSISEEKSGCEGKGKGLNGNQYLVSNEKVPDGKLETEEVNNLRADVSIPEGNSGCQGKGNGFNGSQDLVSNEIVPNVKLEIEEVNDVKADVLVSEANSGSRGEGNGLNGSQDSASNETVTEEVNYVNADVSIPRGGEELPITKKEGEEYYVSDLVWGKVRSHPWWPGQVFDPSAASDKAKKYFKKESYLITYFGDQSFAWNEGPKIKPFHMHFSEMEKQSNADGFCHAVGCAVDEVARRVELGLSCPCLPKEVHDKIKFQVVENAGIREESSKRAGGDNLSSADSFSPGELVQFIGSLAECPKSKTDRLQFATKKAQLLAFNRWKGHNPIFEEFNVLLGNAHFAVPGQVSESVDDFPSKKRKSTVLEGSSRKRNPVTGDEDCPNIKEKYMSSILQNDEKKPKKLGRPPKNRYVNSLPSKESQTMKITPDVILSKLVLAAQNPMQGHQIMISEISRLREFRNSICAEKSSSGYTTNQDDGNLDATNTFGSAGTEDSYWTDRIIQTHSQDQALFRPTTHKAEANNNKEREAVIVDLDTDEENPSVVMNEEVSEEYCPTALILNFTNLDSIPPVTNLNEIFTRYGPLNESDTQIYSKSKRAKVIFKKKADAETAFSSTGKYSIFGPSLISYRLNYEPTPRKSRPASKRSKKTHL